MELQKNPNYYLYNASTVSDYWWTMAPSSYYNNSVWMFVGSQIESASADNAATTRAVRPVINLSYDNALYESGNGTLTNPYTVRYN